MAAVQNKRKRSSQDTGAARAAPGMTQQAGTEFAQHYLQTDADADMDNSIDFSAMVNNSQDVPDTGDVQHNTSHLQPQGQGSGQGNDASDTAAAAMAQFHTMNVPQSTESTFLNTAGEEGTQGLGEGATAGQQRTSSFGGEFDTSAVQGSPDGEGSPTTGLGPHSNKPAVGSDEWHKIRKDNHKEVERRRRETINEGINELAKIVPGNEKNKGSILQRAVQFITQLKENETQNIQKWTLEKLLTEQAIAELSSSCDKLKAECSRAWVEVEQWKKAAQKAGVTSIEEQENGDGDGEGEEES